MYEIILILFCSLISFIVTLIILPKLIIMNKRKRITGRDINKLYKNEIPEMGGISVVIGTLIGIFSIVFILMNLQSIERFPYFPFYSGLLAIVGTAIIGAIDDLINLRQRVKALLPFIIALPFGYSMFTLNIYIPFVGIINFGYLSIPLVAFAVTAAANSANMLEGFNGLGCGVGIIMCVVLITISIIFNKIISLILLFPLVATLIVFYFYNRYPAKIFPGDTMLLFMGSILAISSILGDFEIIGIFLFLPMILEFFLKLRKRFTTESYGKLDRFGNLKYYGSVTSLTHIILKLGRFKEWEVSAIIWTFESIIGIIIISTLILYI